MEQTNSFDSKINLSLSFSLKQWFYPEFILKAGVESKVYTLILVHDNLSSLIKDIKI